MTKNNKPEKSLKWLILKEKFFISYEQLEKFQWNLAYDNFKSHKMTAFYSPLSRKRIFGKNIRGPHKQSTLLTPIILRINSHCEKVSWYRPLLFKTNKKRNYSLKILLHLNIELVLLSEKKRFLYNYFLIPENYQLIH